MFSHVFRLRNTEIRPSCSKGSKNIAILEIFANSFPDVLTKKIKTSISSRGHDASSSSSCVYHLKQVSSFYGLSIVIYYSKYYTLAIIIVSDNHFKQSRHDIIFFMSHQ